MTSIPKKDRLLWLAAAALCLAGLLGWIWTFGIWDHYFQFLPRSPNPAAGRIYPLSIHGIVVYQSLKERSRLDSWDHWSFGIFCCGMVLGGIHQWRSGQLWKR